MCNQSMMPHEAYIVFIVMLHEINLAQDFVTLGILIKPTSPLINNCNYM